MSLSAREIEQAAVARLALLVEEFGELFSMRVTNEESAALDAIEGDWQELRKQTEHVYQKMMSELVNAVDERSMIAKKKQNGESAGYS
jgi:hypothetical protein